MKQKLQAKDFITVGVFTAIMFVVCMAVSMLGFIPVFIPLLSVLVPIISGIPFMLFATKAQKFGMVTLMGVLMGLIMGFMGHGIWAFVAGPLFGLLSDLVMRSGNYKSAKKDTIASGVFFLTIIGMLEVSNSPAQLGGFLSIRKAGTKGSQLFLRPLPLPPGHGDGVHRIQLLFKTMDLLLQLPVLPDGMAVILGHLLGRQLFGGIPLQLFGGTAEHTASHTGNSCTGGNVVLGVESRPDHIVIRAGGSLIGSVLDHRIGTAA